MTTSRSRPRIAPVPGAASRQPTEIRGLVALAFAVGAAAVHAQTVLGSEMLANSLVSGGLWAQIAGLLATRVEQHGDERYAEIPLFGLLAVFALIAAGLLIAGAVVLARKKTRPLRSMLGTWGLGLAVWGLLPAGWELARTVALLSNAPATAGLLEALLPLEIALGLAGIAATFAGLAASTAGVAAPGPESSPAAGEPAGPRLPWSVGVAMAVYVTVFFGLTLGLWANLRIPHGDSAMYEEHLWNLLHGKGFRSYLDGGRLFLGEHVQVIHLLAIPVYLLWPSHLLLELLQSLALAAGAIPVYRLALRHGNSRTAAGALAVGYLLATPMQYLDIAIDFKTFRPSAFEIPLFLWAFDAVERRRWSQFGIALGLTLLCQEDAAMIIAPLGVWIAVFGRTVGLEGWRTRGLVGIGLAALGVVYLLLVLGVILPYFRGGADVHYASYFRALGGSTQEIVTNVFTRPQLVLMRLLSPGSLLFFAALLVPAGLLPLFAPGRLAVAAPLFGVLCLNEISRLPVHHFHAPLVPVIFWAAAAGLATARRLAQRFKLSETGVLTGIGTWAGSCALFSGLFLGLSPASVAFWDPYSGGWWHNLYVPQERARQFEKVLPLIPRTARVASTDFIHPRFTHHARSDDYSDYRPIVPPDTEYLVIDVQGPYSKVGSVDDVKEYRSGEWELVADAPREWFLVLRRKPAPGGNQSAR